MEREIHDDSLAERWTLEAADWQWLANKTGATRLGFAVLLKFFQGEGRFPCDRGEVPVPAVGFLAHQVRVPVEAWSEYRLVGRTFEYHRAQVRRALGFREATLADVDVLLEWTTKHLVARERNLDSLKEGMISRCREMHIEPPTLERMDRIARSAIARFEEEFFRDLMGALPLSSQQGLDSLLIAVDIDAGRVPLHELRADPGPASIETLVEELGKLGLLRGLELPSGLFDGLGSAIVQSYRRRVAVEEIHEPRRHPQPFRLALLAAFCHLRTGELTDTLCDLLLDMVHKVAHRAETRVERELVADFKRVSGKNTLLFEIAEASLAKPEEPVRAVVYPIASEDKLRDLVREFKATGPAYREQLHTVMKSAYRSHYRAMLIRLLDALEFHSNNETHRPVLDALAVVKKYAASRLRTYPLNVQVPLAEIVRGPWQDTVKEQDEEGNQRINRNAYEMCVMLAVRDRLRSKELWVSGANRYRNPDEDLPQDFASERSVYYAALKLPRDVTLSLDQLKEEMERALAGLNDGMVANEFVRILKKDRGWISLSPSPVQAEPANLVALKTRILDRWSLTSLLDILKEADLRVQFTNVFRSATAWENLDITKEQLRSAIREIVDAIFRERSAHIWGEGTTSCASDSKKFGAWDQNLMTEWHVRYQGNGVMIYWHVDRKSTCIHSQLKRCSSSEVAAMIEGVLRHCTEMQVEHQYVDSHGQSEVAFAFCRLLGFDLLPRLKAIHSQRLYRPSSSASYDQLAPVLTRAIDWDLISQHYDPIIQYATGLRLGTAQTEDILRRFTRSNVKHPVYRALAELGKAVKTIFLCRYLGSMEFRREINEGLNVIENWNSANDFIFFGKGGEMTSNRIDDQEISMLSLHLLQVALVYVNTLMIQQVLSEPAWTNRLEANDLRGITPLIYHHVNPYGNFHLDLYSRLPIDPPRFGPQGVGTQLLLEYDRLTG